MRYPISNVPRRPAMHGAMLDAYNAENAKLKETLAKAEEASRADWGRLHPGPVHTPSQFPEQTPPASPPARDIRDFSRPLFPHGPSEGGRKTSAKRRNGHPRSASRILSACPRRRGSVPRGITRVPGWIHLDAVRLPSGRCLHAAGKVRRIFQSSDDLASQAHWVWPERPDKPTDQRRDGHSRRSASATDSSAPDAAAPTQ